MLVQPPVVISLFERMTNAAKASAPPLRAVSLWQPWASAIPLGLKSVETRHWSTQHRGDIAIHAAKYRGPECRKFLDDLGAYHPDDWGLLPFNPPLGAVLAVADLADVVPTERLVKQITERERRWGNYDPFTVVNGKIRKRYGWVLHNVRRLATPVPTVGRQSIWALPPDVAQQVRAQL